MFKHTLRALALSLAIVMPVFASSPVNVNSADARTLAASLDGVGMGKARAIVAYREAHGAFKSIDEVGKAKGVGPKLVARNRDAIHLDGSYPAPTKAAHKSRHRKAVAES